ncbi:MAG: hypothetical protein ACJAS1_002617 [Oleiphilaceae bacterium]
MEKVDLYKQSTAKFIFNEFVIFLSQVLVFFMVTIFITNFLSSEEKLIKFSAQKINDGTLAELGLTFLAILIVIGLFSALGRVFENKYVEYYVNEILCEMPKTIYFFGSSIAGVMLGISLFLNFNPIEIESAKGFASMSVLFAIMAFLYGCAFSYAFKRKTHIRIKPNK